MMEYRWEARNKKKTLFSLFRVGVLPALFVTVYIPQELRKVAVCIPHFFPVGHYLLIEDNNEGIRYLNNNFSYKA